MPSGAKKRKAAAKKKKSSTTNPQSSHQGENDGGELSSPTSQYPSVEVVKREDSSENKGDIKIEAGSKSKSSHGSSSSSGSSSDDESDVVEKNVVVLESAPNESVPAVEPESLTETISPLVDPFKPVDSLLDEVSQVFDEIKNEKKKDLVVEEKPIVVEEQTVVVSETDTKDDCLTSGVVTEQILKENEVEKLTSLDEKASSVLKDYVLSSTPPENLISEVNGADRPHETDTSTPPENLVSEVNGADRAQESDTIGHSNRQAPAASPTVPAASPALAAQRTTTWKSCCGLFELFSGSER